MTEKASAVKVEPFKPRSGITIHTNDEEAREAEMQSGSQFTDKITDSPISLLGLADWFTNQFTNNLLTSLLSNYF